MKFDFECLKGESLEMPRKKTVTCGSQASDEGRDEEELFEEENWGKPVQRNAANARERARMRVLSKAFCRLKTTLPWVPPDTKLSKLDTLRLATSYIAHLRSVLCLADNGSNDEESKPTPVHVPSVHPFNLTWPYNFQFHLNSGSTSSNSSQEEWEQYKAREDFKNPSCEKYERLHFSKQGPTSSHADNSEFTAALPMSHYPGVDNPHLREPLGPESEELPLIEPPNPFRYKPSEHRLGSPSKPTVTVERATKPHQGYEPSQGSFRQNRQSSLYYFPRFKNPETLLET